MSPFIVGSAEAALRVKNRYGIPFVKSWEGKDLYKKAKRLLTLGCPVLGVDVDAAGLIPLCKMGWPVAPSRKRNWKS